MFYNVPKKTERSWTLYILRLYTIEQKHKMGVDHETLEQRAYPHNGN